MNMTNVKTISLIGANQTFTMVGAKKISYDDLRNTISFKFMKNQSGANYVNFTYVPGLDLYTVEFKKVSFTGSCMTKSTTIKKYEGLYGDSLRGIFEQVTGLRTSLTNVYA